LELCNVWWGWTEWLKKEIHVEVDTIDLSGSTGKEVIELIQNLESTYENYGGVFFVEQTKNYNYSEDEYKYIAVYISRQETDEEYNKRILAEKEIKDRQLAYKREQYEKLKAELGVE